MELYLFISVYNSVRKKEREIMNKTKMFIIGCYSELKELITENLFGIIFLLALLILPIYYLLNPLNIDNPVAILLSPFLLLWCLFDWLFNRLGILIYIVAGYFIIKGMITLAIIDALREIGKDKNIDR